MTAQPEATRSNTAPSEITTQLPAGTHVRNFGWTLMVPKAEQQPLVDKLRALVCEGLNLCASVGCSCVTGLPEPPLCFESQAGGRALIVHSEGPTWTVFVIALDNLVRVDVHTTDAMLYHETSAIYTQLLDWNYPLFVHSMSRLPLQ